MPEISETLKGSFTKFFGTVRQKIFDGKTWYPLVCIKFFDTPNFLKHWRMPTKFFGTVSPKIFDGKTWYPPPPLSSIKLFETKSFLKNSRIPLRKFSALWDIKLSTENRDMPPLIHNFFSIPENFRKTEGFLYKAFRFGPVRQKVPTKPWYSPPYPNFFDTRNYCNSKWFPYGNFRHCETKTFRRKILIPPSYPNFFDTRN